MAMLENNLFRHLFNVGGEPFITGGTVRDKLLKMPNRDTDVVVFGVDEKTLRRELGQFGQVLTYGKSYRVYQVRGLAVEFSLPRNRESQENLPLIKRLRSDAEGRDFTVNALYMNPLTEEIKDPLEGLKDIKVRQLRMTCRHAFDDDPLRVLRAVQLSARMGFTLEEKTLDCMRQVSLHTVAQERIYQELNKWLLSPDPARGWKIMEEAGHIPEICETEKGFHQVIGDALTSAVSVRSQSAKPLQWMWGVLLSTCLLSKYQYHQRIDQGETLNRYTRKMAQLSNNHDHTRFISEILWGIDHLQQYAVRKPDVARLSLGVNVDELLLTMKALKPFWHHTGNQRDVNLAMNRISKWKPGGEIRPLVKGTDLKEWGFIEGKTMGILVETAFQMQLEGVAKKEIEMFYKKFQRVLQKIGQ